MAGGASPPWEPDPTIDSKLTISPGGPTTAGIRRPWPGVQCAVPDAVSASRGVPGLFGCARRRGRARAARETSRASCLCGPPRWPPIERGAARSDEPLAWHARACGPVPSRPPALPSLPPVPLCRPLPSSWRARHGKPRRSSRDGRAARRDSRSAAAPRRRAPPSRPFGRCLVPAGGREEAPSLAPHAPGGTPGRGTCHEGHALVRPSGARAAARASAATRSVWRRPARTRAGCTALAPS
jgi:hypothetical protein